MLPNPLSDQLDLVEVDVAALSWFGDQNFNGDLGESRCRHTGTGQRFGGDLSQPSIGYARAGQRLGGRLSQPGARDAVLFQRLNGFLGEEKQGILLCAERLCYFCAELAAVHSEGGPGNASGGIRFVDLPEHDIAGEQRLRRAVIVRGTRVVLGDDAPRADVVLARVRTACTPTILPVGLIAANEYVSLAPALEEPLYVVSSSGLASFTLLKCAVPNSASGRCSHRPRSEDSSVCGIRRGSCY